MTNKGNVNLRNIHNESYIASYESGDVKIKGIDGSTNVFVKKGDLEIHISKISHESRILVEEGDINIKMIDTHPVKLSIDANEVIPDTKFAQYGKEYYFILKVPKKRLFLFLWIYNSVLNKKNRLALNCV